MTKKESSKATVRVNRVDENTDEVFINSDEPYVNRVIFAKSGAFTAGETSLDEIEKKEAKLKQADGSKLGQIEPAKG